MFNVYTNQAYTNQSDILEKFRIKAHLRRYLKDPDAISETLFKIAMNELKKLPYENKDPTDEVVSSLVKNAYQQRILSREELTETGLQLVKPLTLNQPFISKHLFTYQLHPG